MIHLKNVSKVYSNGTEALKNISLDIEQGEFVFIVGSSGAGKSTFLKLLIHEETPTFGKIEVNGYNLMKIKRNKVPYLRRTMGIVFQDFRLIDKMNVYGFGGGSEYIVFRAAVRFAQIVFCLLLCLYCKRSIPQTKRFQKYGDIILLFVMYAFGAITQYDMFARSMVFLYFAILPFLLLFLQYIVAETPFELMPPASSMVGFSEVALYFMIYGVMALSLYMYYSGYYGPMDPGMFAGIRRLLLH